MSKGQGQENEVELTKIGNNSSNNSNTKGLEKQPGLLQRNAFLRQMSAMLSKNAVLQKRFIVGTICECLFPVILIFLSCIYVFLFQNVLDIDSSSFSNSQTNTLIYMQSITHTSKK